MLSRSIRNVASAARTLVTASTRKVVNFSFPSAVLSHSSQSFHARQFSSTPDSQSSTSGASYNDVKIHQTLTDNLKPTFLHIEDTSGKRQ